MRFLSLKNFVRMLALAISLGFAPSALNALAQNTGGGSSTTTTTTQSSQPAPAETTKTTVKETSRTENTTALNPLWLVIGGAALLAILLIAILSARGRSRDRGGDTVYERKTVVKKE